MFRSFLLALAVAVGLGAVAQAGPATAGSDSYLNKYGGYLSRSNRGLGTGIDIGAIHARQADRLEQRWAAQARERAALNANRTPVYVHPPLPTDRLSSRLWRDYPPLGNIAPRYDNGADLANRQLTPPRDRIEPRGVQQYRQQFDRFDEGRDR